MLDIARLDAEDAERFRKIRLASLQDSSEMFSSTYEQIASLSSKDWPEQLRNLPTFVAVLDGEDAGVVRAATASHGADGAHPCARRGDVHGAPP